ncbi:MAG: hypothetical protein ACPG7F_00465 [Aggregatilineales bacterium]
MSGRANHYTRQKSLPRFYAKQRDDLPLKLITLRNAVTDYVCDGWRPRGTQAMARLIRQMHYGDALWSQNLWRLERLQLNRGYPHYRLYHRKNVFGVARVKTDAHWDTAICAMAAYCTTLGFTAKNSYLGWDGATTSLNASTEYLPILFHVRYAVQPEQPVGFEHHSVKRDTEITRKGH